MEIPPTTPEEEKTLQIVIEDWKTRTPLQRAIAISVLRGQTTPTMVAEYLKVGVNDVLATLPGIWGLLFDRSTENIWLR